MSHTQNTMEMILPNPSLCLLASQAVEAAVVPSGWEQMLLYSAEREAAAVAGQRKQQQEVKAVLGEEAALLVELVSALAVDAEPGTVAQVV